MPAVEMPWRKLVESIKRGNCILILGPQVSFDPNNSDYLPLTTALAHRLADHAKLKESKDLINRNDLAHVAQLFKQATDRYELEIAASDFYSAYQAVTTDFHRDLAALPFTLCINAAPDDLFSNAVIEAGKKPAQDYYNFRRHRPSTAIQLTDDQPYIYNLYGHYSNKESLVLTEDDLLEFLANIIKASPELPPLIRSQVADLSKNFLFIGFGFRSWHQRILLHALKAQNRDNESLAVEDKQFFDLPDCSQTVVFYSYLLKIKFECYSWLDFARELRQAYKASETAAAPTQQVMKDAPKVFLCYASEDRDQVEQLCLKLRNLGIEPWQDKQNLRAGDNWDRQLVHVINQQVNYVIVVQTPAMTRQIEGYFYKEIATALERQQKIADGFRFIVPVTLGGNTVLPQLQQLHQIAVDQPDGLAQLVEAILSDWDLRQKKAVA